MSIINDRPVDKNTGERVLPNQLEALRRSHVFRNPCCLCAVINGRTYPEAEIAIVKLDKGEDECSLSVLDGEYVAICAKRRCGFFCESSIYTFPPSAIALLHFTVRLEMFFPLEHLQEQTCRPRRASIFLNESVELFFNSSPHAT